MVSNLQSRSVVRRRPSSSDAAIVRLVTAVCVETHDEWAVAERRYLSEESMSKLYDTTTESEVPLAITA